MAKIQYGVKPDIFEYAEHCVRGVLRCIMEPSESDAWCCTAEGEAPSLAEVLTYGPK